MPRVMLAEQWWADEMRRRLLNASYPNVLTLLNIPVSIYPLVAVYRRQPLRTILVGAMSVVLNSWFVGTLVQRYDRRQ